MQTASVDTDSPRLTPQQLADRLLQRFSAVRAASRKLAAPLSPEDQMVQSCAEASPVKWHLAHTSWFFETFVLREFLARYKDFHPDFHWLFNSYYQLLGEMPEKKLRASFSRPPLDVILAFRTHVDDHITRLLQNHPADEALIRIRLGLEHEQQHQELIATDIKHAFFTNPLHPAYLPQESDPDERIAPPMDWVDFAGGQQQIGSAGTDFAFDNELPRHTVFAAPFRLATRLVTCAEYLAFIEEGSYTRAELWLSEGWEAVRSNGWQAPLYWQRDPATKSGWRIFTLHGWQSLEALSETPVCHISLFEADAYARWAGHRLPTEPEWEIAAATQPVRGNLLERGRLHPAVAPSSPGLQQLFGDVWEWTASPYTGYPGYRPLPGALGEYNGKFMSSQVILRGGSAVTPESHIRATYRNFFSPATRWQFSGIRLAQDATQ